MGWVLRRYQLVLANRRKLKLVPKVAECFSTQSKLFRLTRSGFFPSSTTLDILCGYATEGYRSPLWLCASQNGRAVLIHRNRGSKVDFAQAVQDETIRVVKGIHYFDAHRLVPHLLMSPELQLDPRTENVSDPDGAEESVVDPGSEGEPFLSTRHLTRKSILMTVSPWKIPQKKNLLEQRRRWKRWWHNCSIPPISSSPQLASVHSRSCGCRPNSPLNLSLSRTAYARLQPSPCVNLATSCNLVRLPTTFLFCHPVPYGPMQRLCHPAHFFSFIFLWTYAAPLPSSSFFFSL